MQGYRGCEIHPQGSQPLCLSRCSLSWVVWPPIVPLILCSFSWYQSLVLSSNQGNKTLSAASPPSTPPPAWLLPALSSRKKTWTLCVKWRRKAMLISTFHGSQRLASSFKNTLQLVVHTTIFSVLSGTNNINKKIFVIWNQIRSAFFFLVNIYQVLSSYYSEIDIEVRRPGEAEWVLP